MSRHFATLLGISALLLWATLVGLLRLSTAKFGPMYTATYVYTISAFILYFTYGLPNLKSASKKFLIISSIIFVTFEICYALSITMANTSEKSIELNIIFNLWPTFTIILMALLKEEKVNKFTILGILISFSGIIFINYKDGFNILASIKNNPASYLLILAASILWSIYCLYTKKHSNGVNLISLYFILTAIVLWTLTLFTQGFNLTKVTTWMSYVIIFLNASFFALGYLAWNIGIIKGNMSVLILLSYFAPIFSSVFSMLVLQTNLSGNFWPGSFIVVVGSLISWFSIIRKKVIHH